MIMLVFFQTRACHQADTRLFVCRTFILVSKIYDDQSFILGHYVLQSIVRKLVTILLFLIGSASISSNYTIF